jgi:hypothetical protein
MIYGNLQNMRFGDLRVISIVQGRMGLTRGYVFEEWWCGTKIREHGYEVELSIAGRSNQGCYSMNPFPVHVSAHDPQLLLSPSHYFLSFLMENTTSKSL